MMQVNHLSARIVILTLLMLIVWMISKPTIHRMVKSHLEETTGSIVDLGEVATDLRRGTMEVHDFAIGNPRQANRNLIQAREAVMHFDLAALAHRRLVITRGRASGVRLDTPRTRQGADSPSPPQNNLDQFGLAKFVWERSIPEAHHLFLDHMLSWSAPSQADTPMSNFNPEVLKTSWTRQLNELIAEADQVHALLQQKIQAVQASTQGSNPLRKPKENGSEQQTQLVNLRDRLLAISRQLDNMDVAGQKEIEQTLPKLNPAAAPTPLLFVADTHEAALTQILLHDLALLETHKVLEWLDWFYSVYPDADRNFTPRTAPGRDVQFSGLPEAPAFLIQTLDIEGSGTIHGEHYELAGKLENYSPHPGSTNRPTLIGFRAQGQHHFAVNATLDRSGPSAADHFSIVCPDFNIAARTLGSESTLQANLSSTTCQAQADLQVIDNQLTGSIRIAVAGSGIFIEQVAAHAGGEDIRNLLNQEVAAIQNFEFTVKLQGTREQLQASLESDLGQKLYAALAAAHTRNQQLRSSRGSTQLQASTFGEELRQFLSQEVARARSSIDQKCNVANQVESILAAPTEQKNARLR